MSHHRHFKHLHVPEHWEQYWSKYPNGYTVLEALINWTSQVNDMVDSQNQVSDQMTSLKIDYTALEKELRMSWDAYKEYNTKTYSDFTKEIYTIINNWIATIEPTIQDETVKKLNNWLDDGTLADIINTDVFNMKANQKDIESRALNVKYPPAPLVGAKGDGITDDTEAIQNLLNLLENNTSLFVPDGIFNIKNLIIPNKWGIKIEFRGLLRAIEGGDSDFLVATENYVTNLPEAGQAITLINPRIDGNGIVKNGLVIQTWNTLVDRPDIINCENGLKMTAETRDGTTFPTSTLVNNVVKEPNIHNNSNYGIWVRDPDRNRVTDYSIVGGFIFTNKVGLYLESFAGVSLDRLHTYSNTEKAIYISLVSVGGRISNSYLEEPFAVDIGDFIQNQYLNFNGNNSNGSVNLYSSKQNSGINSVGNTFKTESGKFKQRWGSSTVYSSNDLFESVEPYMNVGNDGGGTSEATNVFYVQNANSNGIGLRRIIQGIVQFNRINTVEYGSGQPTSGTYKIGDKVIVRAPVPEGYAEYICTQSGSPGIWKGTGRLSL